MYFKLHIHLHGYILNIWSNEIDYVEIKIMGKLQKIRITLTNICTVYVLR